MSESVETNNDKPELDVMINNAFSAITAQVRAALSLAAGSRCSHVLSAMLNDEGLLEIWRTALMEGYNNSVDEYNQILDYLDARDATIDAMKLTSKELHESVVDLETKLDNQCAVASEAEAELSRERAVSARLGQALNDQKREMSLALAKIRELKQIEDHFKQAKAREESRIKDMAELKAANAEMRKNTNKLRVERANAVKRTNELIEVSTQQQEYIKELQQRLNYTEDTEQAFPAEDGTTWYIQTCGWALDAALNDRALILPNWHIMLRNTSGIAVLVMIDEFLEPLIPNIPQTANLPEGLRDALRRTFISRLEESHPDHVIRRHWLLATPVHALESLSPALVKKLDNLGHQTLMDLCIVGKSGLAAQAGFGEKTAETVFAALNQEMQDKRPV